MSREQALSVARWVITTFGGFIAGIFAAKGWVDSDTILGILNSETVISLIATIITLVWGVFSHSPPAMVAALTKLPEVDNNKLAQAVGPELAQKIPL